MNRGLGIGAMVASILAIFVPVVGIYVVWLGLGLAVIAGLMGDKTYPIVTILISFINIIFLSPMTLILFKGENENGNTFFFYMTIVLIIAPILAMIGNTMIETNKSKN